MSTTKKYKRIILHAGLHKTGTTSIQDSCHRSRDWLLERGIVYPYFEFGGKKFANHSNPIAAAVGTDAKLYGVLRRLNIRTDPSGVVSAFSKQLQEIMENPAADTLLLSGELVCDMSKSDLGRLRRYLERYSESLEVVALVRSPQSSLESMLQQRTRGGFPADPASLVNAVRSRYLRLRIAFTDTLRVINFHEAIKHPLGVVGWLLCDIGLPAEEVATLDFRRSNESMSMEAFLLMEAINQAYPAGEEAAHGLHRLYNDMHSLNSLPGQPFQLKQEIGTEIASGLEEEANLLAQELQFTFPPVARKDSGALWQPETLLALESAINKLDHRLLRDAATAALNNEAARIEHENAETAAVLCFIARRIGMQEDPTVEQVLERLGADYFKFSALQVEGGSYEMSLMLMLLAKKLRPDAPFIDERIQHYRTKLEKT